MAFERLSFGSDPVYSHVVDACFIADGRDLNISTDRSGSQRWLTDQEQLASAREAFERARANAEQAQALRHAAETRAQQAEAEAEHERQARLELERRLRELESRLPR